MKFSSIDRPSHAAFTLIEVIIVVTIILTMVGVITANYVQYSEEKKLGDAMVNLRTTLTLARSKATAGDIGSYPCDDFKGYRVSFDELSATYSLDLCCNTGCDKSPAPPTPASYEVSKLSLKSNIEIRTDFDVRFNPFARKTSLTNPISIELKNNFINRCNFITITPIGVVDTGTAYSC